MGRMERRPAIRGWLSAWVLDDLDSSDTCLRSDHRKLPVYVVSTTRATCTCTCRTSEMHLSTRALHNRTAESCHLHDKNGRALS